MSFAPLLVQNIRKTATRVDTSEISMLGRRMGRGERFKPKHLIILLKMQQRFSGCVVSLPAFFSLRLNRTKGEETAFYNSLLSPQSTSLPTFFPGFQARCQVVQRDRLDRLWGRRRVTNVPGVHVASTYQQVHQNAIRSSLFCHHHALAAVPDYHGRVRERRTLYAFRFAAIRDFCGQTKIRAHTHANQNHRSLVLNREWWSGGEVEWCWGVEHRGSSFYVWHTSTKFVWFKKRNRSI